MSDDPNELVYVENSDPELNDGAWVTRSALRQLSSQNWFEAEPPADSLRGATALERNLQEDPNELVKIHHKGLGATVTVPRSAVRQHALSGWTEEGETPPHVPEGAFDPNEVGYKEVLDYLSTADDAERARVIAVEKAAANPRKTIVQWEPPADKSKEGDS